jgi:hypothetical protein
MIAIIKNSVRKNSFVFVVIVLLLFIAVHAKAQTQIVTIHFENKVGDNMLEADSIYQNDFGETFSIRSFKYYISNIVLNDSDRKQSFPDQYFLVDNNESSSQPITFSASLQHITSIKFLLGVDSLKNVSGVQTGTLDPAKGMFWTWNTGYVMAKLEGNSPFANMPQHAFSYHVGGYKQNENAAREINLRLPQAIDCVKGCAITVSADVLKWFNSIHKIKIAETPFCHEPGKLAMMLADNYANMFSIGTK